MRVAEPGMSFTDLPLASPDAGLGLGFGFCLGELSDLVSSAFGCGLGCLTGPGFFSNDLSSTSTDAGLGFGFGFGFGLGELPG